MTKLTIFFVIPNVNSTIMSGSQTGEELIIGTGEFTVLKV